MKVVLPALLAFIGVQTSAFALIGVADLTAVAGSNSHCATDLKLDFDVDQMESESSESSFVAVSSTGAAPHFEAVGGRVAIGNVVTESQIHLNQKVLSARSTQMSVQGDSRVDSSLNWDLQTSRVSLAVGNLRCEYQAHSAVFEN